MKQVIDELAHICEHGRRRCIKYGGDVKDEADAQSQIPFKLFFSSFFFSIKHSSKNW